MGRISISTQPTILVVKFANDEGKEVMHVVTKDTAILTMPNGITKEKGVISFTENLEEAVVFDNPKKARSFAREHGDEIKDYIEEVNGEIYPFVQFKEMKVKARGYTVSW